MTLYSLDSLPKLPKQYQQAVQQRLDLVARNSQRIVQRMHEATLRLFLLKLPIQKIALLQKLGNRKIDSNYPAIEIAGHIDITTAIGRSVAEFSICPSPYFALHPLDDKQIAKAHELLAEKKCQPNSADKIQQFEQLLTLCKNNWTTLADFTRSDWNCYDEINFELTKEYLQNLASVFANPCFEKCQKILKEFGVNLQEMMVAEALAKSLVYCEGSAGKELYLPVQNPKTGNQELILYQMEELHFGKELPAYILKPAQNSEPSPSEPSSKEAPSWLVARGTQALLTVDAEGCEFRKGAWESLQADMNPDSMTQQAVDLAIQKESLTNFLQLTSPKKLAGHSLGGALVIDLATRYPDQVDHVDTFSPPSLGPIEAERWSKTLDKKVLCLDALGDLVPIGGYHVKGCHLEIDPKELKHPLFKHNEIMLNKAFQIRVVDNEMESKRTARRRIAIIQRLQKRYFNFSPKAV